MKCTITRMMGEEKEDEDGSVYRVLMEGKEMKHASFRDLILLILAALIVVIRPLGAQAQAQEKSSGEKVGDLSSPEAGAEKAFREARENFLRKEYQSAAAEIRRGGEFLDKEAKLATEARKKALIASARELDQLAERERKGTVHSVQELEQVFARAEHALAGYYHSKALESWYGKAVLDAGRYLKAAAIHLENALNWSGQKLEAGGVQTIREGKEIGEKMEKGAGWVDSEVRNAVEGMKKEIDEAGHKIGVSK